MAKYRKKPVVVEAFQFKNFMTGDQIPKWFMEHIEKKGATEWPDNAVCITLEGKMLVKDGDFIIRGIQGEIYPCKPDIFAATYELVTDTE